VSRKPPGGCQHLAEGNSRVTMDDGFARSWWMGSAQMGMAPCGRADPSSLRIPARAVR